MTEYITFGGGPHWLILNYNVKQSTTDQLQSVLQKNKVLIG